MIQKIENPVVRLEKALLLCSQEWISLVSHVDDVYFLNKGFPILLRFHYNNALLI